MVDSISGSSLIGLYNGQTALSLLGAASGSSSTDTSSLILADMEAKEGISNAADGSSATTKTGPTAPWNSATGMPSVSDAVRQAVDGSKLIDTGAAKLDAPAGTSASDYKGLFALYQGLNTLSDLAQTAAQQASSSTSALTSSSPYTAEQLQSAFNSGLSQLQSFLASDAFKGFNVTGGQVGSTQLSTVKIADTTNVNYSTGPVATGDPAVPVAGFGGDVKFTITLSGKYMTKPTTVDIDLADMGSTPRTMDAVAAYINSKLKAAGSVSTFSVTQLGTTPSTTTNGVTTPGEPQWGFNITGVSDETLSFSASSTAASVYVSQGTGGATTLASGSSSTTTTAAGEQLVKLDTQNNATGATVTSAYPTAADDNLPQSGVFANALPDGVTGVKASAVGADGSLYLLADATGSVNGAPTPGAQGVALLRYDSSGQLLYSKVLPQGPDATGYSLAVGPDGQVAVAGTDTAPAASGSSAKSTAFVQVFAADGSPSWSQSVPALGGTSSAAGVTIGADGSVYLSGTTTGSVGDQIPHGDSDEFIQGFKPDGTATFTTQFGSAGDNSSAGLAYDSTTNSLYSAGLENGHAVVRSFSLNGAAKPTATAVRDLGSASSVVGIGVANGQVSVAGNVIAPTLNAGTVAQAFTGTGDAFVANLTTGLTPADSDNVAYLGVAGATETATGFSFAGGQAYVTGTVSGDPHTLAASGATEGFVTGVDAGTGATTYSTRLAGANGQDAPTSIAASASGASALDLLGLPDGSIDPDRSNLIVANTSIKAGDSFYIRTSASGAQTPVTITATDTITTLANKINNALGYQGTATVETSSSGDRISIVAASTSSYIELNSQSSVSNPVQSGDGTDVLAALGLQDGILRKVKTVQNGLTDPTQARDYALNLPSGLSIGSAAQAQAASTSLQSAMATIQQAYQDLVNPPTLASEAASKAQGSSGAVPAYLTAEISNYQAGLARLTGGG
jgi:hypothetical protein